jgi:hypothetical protein
MGAGTVHSNTSMGNTHWGPTKKVEDSESEAENLDDVEEKHYQK